MPEIQLMQNPTLEEIERFKRIGYESFFISSSIGHGAARIHLKSIWRVNYENKSIRLVTSHLTSYYDKIPLIPFDIPDRHLRSIRKLGNALFETKRFDNLILCETKDPSVIYSAIRGEESLTLSDIEDAKLWLLQEEGEGKIESQSTTEKSKLNDALLGSAILRTEILRSMNQAVFGIKELEHIKTLLERGADPKNLEKIWRDAHDSNIVPDVLRTILYGKGKRS